MVSNNTYRRLKKELDRQIVHIKSEMSAANFPDDTVDSIENALEKIEEYFIDIEDIIEDFENEVEYVKEKAGKYIDEIDNLKYELELKIIAETFDEKEIEEVVQNLFDLQRPKQVLEGLEELYKKLS